ncbi:ubiquitin-conjugating enzyme E2 E2-like [Frankliniella occidentalis]|uniref:Ubiquitin-conjugating enzyme E2 E2-like n=1 Tax=Frankliniella occidentalis TaxID=133901 RepID=A0A9C6X554_FRAOC|nr:ubiquitin-conjugating enzyme E2 E2-like [Frankliniella occidentalis]
MGKKTIPYIGGAPGTNLYEWKCFIHGPKGTPYEGGKYEISMRFSKSYPFVPPRCQFITKIYHCNINTEGDICLSTLKKDWKAAFGVESILLSLYSLLSSPNPDDPLMLTIARQYKVQKEQHDSNAKKWTIKYAMKENAEQ